VPLRLRFEFLQKRDVPEESWSNFDLSNDHADTWGYVNAFAWRRLLTERQRSENRRNVLNLVINKFVKATNLTKLLISYGAADANRVAFILRRLADVRQINAPGRAARIAERVSGDGIAARQSRQDRDRTPRR
jgi:hypothetical protein